MQVNLLVNSRYCAVITDFGSARRLKNKYPDGRFKHDEPTLPLAPPLQATFFAPTNTITLTGNKYTLRWAAPELLMDDQPTLWSDIWALGWICYEVKRFRSIVLVAKAHGLALKGHDKYYSVSRCLSGRYCCRACYSGRPPICNRRHAHVIDSGALYSYDDMLEPQSYRKTNS